MKRKKYRSVFISDCHLGFKHSNSKLLANFIRSFDAENLYLVGDIIDVWELQKKVRWNDDDTAVIRAIMIKKKRKTKIVYIFGNHDGIFRKHLNKFEVENVLFTNETIHVGVDGKKYLIVHGDLFDNTQAVWEVLSRIGNTAYDWTIEISQFVNKVRSWFGLPYFSLSLYLKQNVKGVINYINKFERHMVEYCNSKNANGAIAGHIHQPGIRKIGDLIYMNCGDWIENNSALVEHLDGRFEIIYWTENLYKEKR